MKESTLQPERFPIFFLILLCFTLLASTVQARDVVFSWTANSEPVDGYRLYYKTGTSGAPYDGTGALEGNSPVDTGNVTRFTLHGLSDTQTYYFVVTAVSGAQESNYSTELTVTPLATPPATDITATFSWLPNQEEDLAGYKIHYGTASGNYTQTVDVGNPALVDDRVPGQVNNLTEGTTYYFVATACNTSGIESDYSTEVVWTATAPSTGGSPPVASDLAINTAEDQPVSGTVSATNDTGLPITYEVQQDVSNGSLFLETGSGSFSYTPHANFAGSDNFTFIARDSNGDSNIASVAITVTAVNAPPTADNVTISGNEDASVNGQLQAQDPDGDSLTYTAVANPDNGTLSLSSTGAYTYTPTADFSGTDSFTYRVSDGQATSATTTASITVHPVNDAPVALDGTLDAVLGQTTAGTLQATDKENDALTYTIVSDPQQLVTITNAATGSYTFTPAEDTASPYSFTFSASDGTAASNSATVTVTLQEPGMTTVIFGDTPDATYPGTLADTFTNLNEDINAANVELITYSWSNATPHTPANTIIIKVDLSALNSKTQITEAKLYLYQTGSNGDETYENSVHKITGKNPIIEQVNGYNAYNGEPWTAVPPDTTFNDIPLGLADIEEAEDSVVLGTGTGCKSWLVTGMVQEWISDSAANKGLLITGVPTAAETGRTFASSENEETTLRPKLVIRYVRKPPTPTVHSAIKIQ
jgi:VCBS repeat-containing protein